MGEPIAEVGQLAGVCGHDGTDWQKVGISASDRLKVEVEDPGGVDLQDVLDQLEILAAAIVYRSTTPINYSVTMTLANTEYSQTLPTQCKKFTIKCRGEYDIKLAFAVNESGTNYMTIPTPQNYWEDLIRDASLTLYFQCGTAAQVAEITAWN